MSLRDRYIESYHDGRLTELLEDLSIVRHSHLKISPEYLKQLHPDLTTDQCEDLLRFCQSQTIIYRECYGDGSIMIPKWREYKRANKYTPDEFFPDHRQPGRNNIF